MVSTILSMPSPSARLKDWLERTSTTKAAAILVVGALVVADATSSALAGLLNRLAGDVVGHELERVLSIGATVALVGLPAAWALVGLIKRRVATEIQLHEARARANATAGLLESTLANVPDSIALFDAEGRLQLFNRAYARLFGATADLLVPGARFEDLIRTWAERGLAPDAIGRVESWVEQRMHRFRHPPGPMERVFPDGSWWQINEHRTAEGGVVQIASDITPVKEREAALRASEERFRQFAEAASDWFWEFDAEQRFTYVSERIRSVLGMQAERMLHNRPDDIVPDMHEQAGWPAYRDAIAARRPFRDFVVRFVAHDGNERHVKVSGVPVLDGDGALLGYRGTGTDITERTRAEARVQHLAHHDALTGLPNRTLFHDRFRQALAQAERSGSEVAILLIDLDHFKDINDTFGHDAGDFLLCRVTERLADCIRKTDTVARMGGDEFAIVLTGLRQPADASHVAQTIVESLSEPIAFHGQNLCVGASVGVTIYPSDDTEPDLLLRNADVALYQAKENGRGGYSFFVPEMTAEIDRRRRLEHDLRLALAHDQFVLHYQPQVSLEDGRLIGFEALLRWQHPERGLIGPAAFIGLANELGLTVPIGERVLHHACLQARTWLDAGLEPGRIAVNLSMAEFHRADLARTVRSVLNDTRLPASLLEIEIAEDVLIEHDSDRVLQKLTELRQLGVTFALDNFGTGYASLSYLRRFRVDRLKIDHSFVRDIGSDPDDAAIARAVINLGHSLNLEVIAEGVEGEEQASFLHLNGCDGAQGYHFAPPLPAAEATALLERTGAPVRELLPS